MSTDTETAILSIFAPTTLQAVVKIEDVEIDIEPDNFSDGVGDYGRYTDNKNLGDFFIDRKEQGDWSDGDPMSERYFVPEYYDPAHPEHSISDYNRSEAIRSGDIYHVFVSVRVKIQIEFRMSDVKTISVSHTLVSHGLGWVESDSGGDYIRDIASEEFGELRSELLSFGFTHAEIDWWGYVVETKEFPGFD